ncbi:ionotropic receptor 75a isoform X1 [Bactrocera oleae]|uniref:ionotropic receptor 75a isoform X1 n=2 Tax=Bactrocera oleae TaxID=104688 RepID=UPI00387E8379
MQLNTVLIKEEKLRFKKRVPAMRSHFLLLICCIFRLASAEHLGNSTVEEPTRGVYDAQIFMEYFRWHGVHNIMLVVCPQDVVTKEDHHKLKSLLRQFIAHGFSTRVFNGQDYDDNENTRSPVQAQTKVEPSNTTDTSAVDSTSVAPAMSRATYGPPHTFRSDNITRRPLRLQLSALTYKSGILLLHFASACALNVLRWAAAAEHNYFTTNRFWLLFTDEPAHISLLDDENIFLPPDGEVRVMLQQAGTQFFTLVDVYKIAADKPLRRTSVGGRELREAEDMLQALSKFGSAISYRQNLEGITFNTGLVIAFPDMFTNIEDLSLRHIDTISKVNNRLTLELANKLNLRFNTHQVDNYGWHQPNGSFDGLMGRFQRYELDFGQMAIFMRLDRIAIVDFVAETYRIRAGIMFRQPPLSAVANIFAMPFASDVWIAILLLMIFTIGIFMVELVYSPHLHEIDILDCVVFVWGAICQQGFYANLLNRSARVIIFTTFVSTLFLYTSFSANIVALLQSPSEAIQTLSDLTQSPLEVGVQDTVYNKIYFNESTDPITNHLYHKKIAPKGENIFMRPSIGMEKMRTGLFAYQVELQAGYQIISNTFSEPEKCGLKELEPFQLPMIAVPTRKNFPYKELFRRQLRWQREVGLMNREELKWFPQKPKCEGGMGGFVSIGITECRYSLGIFGFGLLLSAFSFILELAVNYVWNLTKKIHRNKKQRETSSAADGYHVNF